MDFPTPCASCGIKCVLQRDLGKYEKANGLRAEALTSGAFDRACARARTPRNSVNLFIVTFAIIATRDYPLHNSIENSVTGGGHRW